jgi:Flp pilus assembly protein TadB
MLTMTLVMMLGWTPAQTRYRTQKDQQWEQQWEQEAGAVPQAKPKAEPLAEPKEETNQQLVRRVEKETAEANRKSGAIALGLLVCLILFLVCLVALVVIYYVGVFLLYVGVFVCCTLGFCGRVMAFPFRVLGGLRHGRRETSAPVLRDGRYVDGCVIPPQSRF